MAMLQYRHKTRAFRQMVTHDEAGNPAAIKDLIGRGIAEGEQGGLNRDRDLELLMQRMRANRTRLAPRLPGLPDDATLRAAPRPAVRRRRCTPSWSATSGTARNVGGEEVDVDWLLPEPETAVRAAAAVGPRPGTDDARRRGQGRAAGALPAP